MTHTIVMVGLGATGLAMAASLLRRTDVQIVGAADRNPAVVGADLGTLAGLGASGVTVIDEPSRLPAADLAIVATTSDLGVVVDTLVPLLERSYNVMSICEELSYPWSSHPDIARRLDETAKANDVTVLGTGANPGVLMDTLPLLLTTLTQRVERIVIRRRTNMSRYGAILSKFGLGLTPARFDGAQASGAVVGHYGFEQAISALATGLGWSLDAIVVERVSPSRVSDTVRTGDHVVIQPGEIAAVTHAARGTVGGRTVIDLEIMFGFFDGSDPVSAGDDYRIEGADQVIELSSPVGFESFVSTIAAAVNVATAVVHAPRGFLSMGDLPVARIASKGTHLAEAGPL
ncbi:dihydrodipicolinate reductase [Nocardia testacea]|uniref:dihydrodipicolinate reductase n=1 Tax=Nocardia testacea TaxID=248551 RepID=UPI00031BE8DC|nr:dihydrodipicolinate reductase [Nocardia testacea]